MMAKDFGDYKAQEMLKFENEHLPEIVSHYGGMLELDFLYLLQTVESPIEAKFLSWFIRSSQVLREKIDFVYDPRREYFAQRVGFYQFISQFELGPYRADFALYKYHMNGTITRIVIECDGHDYHERTKEQAMRDRKRDRDMILEGWSVLRFTGSEIHNNAEGCVQEVFNHLEQDEITDWRIGNE